MSTKDYVNEFEDEDIIEENIDKTAVLKRIGIGSLIIIGVVIIVMLLKGCFNINKMDDPTTMLIKAGKQYFEYNEHLQAKNIGECTEVSLEKLISLGLVNPENYKDCDNENTLVKVCKLPSGGYQWTPWLSCTSDNSETKYGAEFEGKESDLVKDMSLVRFRFIPQKLIYAKDNLGDTEEKWQDEITISDYKTLSSTTYYRYRDLEYIWNVNLKYYYTSNGEKTSSSSVKEYYASSPASGYTSKDSKVTNATKWYTTDGNKIYYTVNGNIAYLASQPNSEYTKSETGKTLTEYRKRTWTEQSKPTNAEPVHYYRCALETNPKQYLDSFYPCGSHPAEVNKRYSVFIKEWYSCDGYTEVTSSTACKRCPTGLGLLNNAKTSCGYYSDWSAYSESNKCSGSTDLCQSKVTNLYKWYKTGNGGRKYYPSGSSSASGEKVYYTSSPVKGAIKDTQTQTTAYKWYKSVSGATSGYSATSPSAGSTKTDKSRWSEWTTWSKIEPSSLGDKGNRKIESRIKIKYQVINGTSTNDSWENVTNDYVTLEEMISALKELKYNVNSLSDITANGELRYQVKMFIRNKEAK